MKTIKTMENNQIAEKQENNNRKITKIAIIVISIFVIACVSVFCFVKYNQNKLNESEEVIYNALVEGLDNFYNPQSVKILECSDVLTKYDEQNPYFVSKDDGVSHCYIKINAATKLGSSTNEIYCLVVDENAAYTCGSMWTWDDVIENVDSFADDPSYSFSSMLGFSEISDYYVEQSESVDVGKLNKALKKHWSELGLD